MEVWLSISKSSQYVLGCSYKILTSKAGSDNLPLVGLEWFLLVYSRDKFSLAVEFHAAFWTTVGQHQNDKNKIEMSFIGFLKWPNLKKVLKDKRFATMHSGLQFFDYLKIYLSQRCSKFYILTVAIFSFGDEKQNGEKMRRVR